jgi:hypothetical protein
MNGIGRRIQWRSWTSGHCRGPGGRLGAGDEEGSTRGEIGIGRNSFLPSFGFPTPYFYVRWAVEGREENNKKVEENKKGSFSPEALT